MNFVSFPDVSKKVFFTKRIRHRDHTKQFSRSDLKIGCSKTLNKVLKITVVADSVCNFSEIRSHHWCFTKYFDVFCRTPKNDAFVHKAYIIWTLIKFHMTAMSSYDAQVRSRVHGQFRKYICDIEYVLGNITINFIWTETTTMNKN